MRVPVDIVTGFLGSGKTTLLRHVLAHGLDGRRVAVIVNDMAEMGIDARVVSSLQNVETMVELESGCICCSIDFRFEYAVQDIVETVEPDLVLIEATGLADPRILIDKIPTTRLVLDAVITVVDAENVGHALQLSTAAAGQIEEADFLVINKTDLVSPEQLVTVGRQLTERNPRALQVPSRFGAVDASILFGTSGRQYCERERPSEGRRDHLAFDAIESFTCVAKGYLERDRFETLVRQLPPAVYRAKGLVWFAREGAPSFFNFTCGRYQSQWLPAPSRGSGEPAVDAQAVFLGRGVSALGPGLADAFTACVASGT